MICEEEEEEDSTRVLFTRVIPARVARCRLALGLHHHLVIDAELAVGHPAQPALDHNLSSDMRTQNLTCSGLGSRRTGEQRLVT